METPGAQAYMQKQAEMGRAGGMGSFVGQAKQATGIAAGVDPVVLREFAALESAQGALDDLLGLLESRIQAVTRPGPPTGAGGSPAPSPTPFASPLALAVIRLRESVERQHETLRTLIERLEV